MKIKVKNLPPLPGYPPAKKVGRDVVGMTSKHITKLEHIPKAAPVLVPGHTKPITWTDERLKELGRLYDEGLPLEEIAENIGSTVKTMSKYMTIARERGYITTFRQKHRGWTHEEDMIMLQMKRQGHASDVIAQRLGRTRSSVMNRLRVLKKG